MSHKFQYIDNLVTNIANSINIAIIILILKVGTVCPNFLNIDNKIGILHITSHIQVIGGGKGGHGPS